VSFAILRIIRQRKKHYGNSNISPCINIIFKKSSKRNHNPLRYYNPITLESKNPIKIDGQNHHTEDKREGQKQAKRRCTARRNQRTL
jgi:hypothetical protein